LDSRAGEAVVNGMAWEPHRDANVKSETPMMVLLQRQTVGLSKNGFAVSQQL